MLDTNEITIACVLISLYCTLLLTARALLNLSFSRVTLLHWRVALRSLVAVKNGGTVGIKDGKYRVLLYYICICIW